MLGQEAFKQDNGGSQQGLEQRDGATLSSGFQQKLQDSESNHTSSVIEIRPDLQREQRKGVPEVIFGETKAIGQIVTMARNILEETGRAVISRVQPEAVAALRGTFRPYTVPSRKPAYAAAIYRPDQVRRSTRALVGVISTGTPHLLLTSVPPLLPQQ